MTPTDNHTLTRGGIDWEAIASLKASCVWNKRRKAQVNRDLRRLIFLFVILLTLFIITNLGK